MMKNTVSHLLLLLVAIGLSQLAIYAQTTKFTYQGSLTQSGQPANGSFEMKFELYDALSAGSQVGSTLTVNPVTVSKGGFSVELDFGSSAFSGADRYLQITIRDLAGGSAVQLSPRSLIRSVPYAIRSLTVTGPLTGADPAARLVVTNSQPGIANPSPTNLPPAAIKGDATSATAVTVGVIGIANKGIGVVGLTADDNSVGDSAVAVTGIATSTSGNTTGISGEVLSPDGTAVSADLPPGGNGYLFQGSSGSAFFEVHSDGNVNISKDLIVDGGGNVRGNLATDGRLNVGGALIVVGVTSTSDLNVNGNLSVSGTKSNVVVLKDGRKVLLYAMEAPASWFEDFGTVELRDGRAVVKLDKVFSEVTNTEVPYKVFLTPNGDCRGLYVFRKTAESFEVRELGGGKSNVSFDFRIVARRRGYEKERFAAAPEARPKN